MNEHALKVLEFPVLLKYFSQFTDSEPTKRKIRELRPSNRYTDVVERLEEVTECIRLMREKDLNVSIIPEDLSESIANSRIQGWMLPPLKIAEIGILIKHSGAVRKTVMTFDGAPRIRAMIEVMSSCEDLGRMIDNTVNEAGDILDQASSELSVIRRKIRKTLDSIRSRMQTLAMELYQRNILQEPIVTLRNERYVLPVKAEQSRLVPGIVHDRSASGVTTFVEPQAIIKMNNSVSELHIAERREIQRVLKEITKQIGNRADRLEYNYRTLIEFDLIVAKARFAQETGANQVQISRDPIMKLVSCRNPLLVLHKQHSETRLGDDSPVVPIDIEIGDGNRILVITGPNTGGKTVALKSAGLTQLMIQSGLYPTCSPDSTVGVFADIFADIGDEQSLEQSLSTFSAHLKQIVPILDQADKHSLVLLDELGAGTDPTEGSALGIAILAELLKRDVTVLATTHHNTIKAFAYTTSGIANAAVEFDGRTLRPTYRIIMNQIGQSNALSIAARLGIPEPVLKAANANLEGKPADLEKMLKIVEDQKRTVTRIRARADAEASRARELRRAREDVLQKAREDARIILENAYKNARTILDEIDLERKNAQRSTEHGKRLRRKAERDVADHDIAGDATGDQPDPMADLIERFRHVFASDPGSAEPDFVPVPGDIVRIDAMGIDAEVLRIQNNGKITIDLRGKKIKVPLSAVSAVAPDESSGNKGEPKRVEVSYEEAMPDPDTVGIRLNLIGRTTDDAVNELEKYIDRAYRLGMPVFTVVHGFGTGKLQEAVEKTLRKHPLVRHIRPGREMEGGAGVTVAEMEPKR
ncbi:endonuclease MutS2 [bacterium]|nr:endonuclease MutS2 [candidate division CSSED10-310 bacterium]